MKLEAARFQFPRRHERFIHYPVCDLHYRVSKLFGWAFTHVSLVNDYLGLPLMMCTSNGGSVRRMGVTM